MKARNWISNVGVGAAISALAFANAVHAQNNPDREPEVRIPDNPRLGLEGPRVLVLLAHPDDEVLLMPALSRIARSGGTVTIAYATSGDASPGLSDAEQGTALAKLREQDARCSAFALRLEEPQFWQLGEGTLASDAHLPDSTARTLITYVDQAIRQTRPNVIFTFGPDGASGHADHRMVSAATTQVVQAMDGGRPDLLYLALPAKAPPDLPGFESWAAVNPVFITDRIAFEPRDIAASKDALQCYQTQFDEGASDQLIEALNQNLWRGQVHMRLALPNSTDIE
ncbi:MAG: PIG-L family deacetylase [Pseudomonadota bacterium]